MFVATVLSLPPLAQSNDNWSGFFDTIGGSANIRIVGENSIEARPLREFASEIIGARFYKRNATEDPFLDAVRGLDHFTASCSTAGGLVLDEEAPRTELFFERTAAHLVQPTGHKHQWRAIAAICDVPDGATLAGYLAVIKDNSEVMRSGDLGSRLFGSLRGLKTTTAVYLFKPDNLPTRSEIETADQLAARQADDVEEQMALAKTEAEEFQRSLAIGDETNCGTVVDIRGPMAEIALPANRRAPNGEAIIWSRIERLQPSGSGVCTFGL